MKTIKTIKLEIRVDQTLPEESQKEIRKKIISFINSGHESFSLRSELNDFYEEERYYVIDAQNK